MKRFLFCLLCSGLASLANSAAADTNFLPEEIAPGVPKRGMVHAWLMREALAALDRRDAAFEEARRTPEAITKWQTTRRDFFNTQLGGFPERSPLQPEVTGRRAFPGYRIEKILFHSQPGFPVTATLYLPEGPGPFPAVLHPTGHSPGAKARDVYQQASIVIARGGCAVLCYDPVGQGERRQFFREDGSPRFSTTEEHTLMNQACTLLGSNTARYMIWDAMRAIDYLQSRADIRRDRIGCTGISGGGTLTSYLMALDPRITAAAPGCYLTGFRSLLTTIGPQDAEQNIHGQLNFGLDHADYVLMRAPKPTLIMAATRDYFDIGGAWDLFRQGKRVFTTLGFPEQIDLVEPDTDHGFPPEMRLAAAHWMRRWLLDTDRPVTGGEPAFLPEEELLVTPEGQVARLPGTRTVHDLNREWSDSFAAHRETAWRYPAAALDRVRELIVVRPLAGLPEPRLTEAGILERAIDGVEIRKVVVEPEPGIFLPAVVFQPSAPSGPVPWTIHLEGEGKDAAGQPGGACERLARAGTAVFAVDLRGLGETRPTGAAKGLAEISGVDWKESTLASLLDRSLVGLRAEDIWQSVRALRTWSGRADLRPDLTASGRASIAALHAAALGPDLFGTIRLRGMIPSWEEAVVQAPVPLDHQADLIFGALRHYDLPHLIESLPPDRIVLEKGPGDPP